MTFKGKKNIPSREKPWRWDRLNKLMKVETKDQLPWISEFFYFVHDKRGANEYNMMGDACYVYAFLLIFPDIPWIFAYLYDLLKISTYFFLCYALSLLLNEEDASSAIQV